LEGLADDRGSWGWGREDPAVGEAESGARGEFWVENDEGRRARN